MALRFGHARVQAPLSVPALFGLQLQRAAGLRWDQLSYRPSTSIGRTTYLLERAFAQRAIEARRCRSGACCRWVDHAFGQREPGSENGSACCAQCGHPRSTAFGWAARCPGSRESLPQRACGAQRTAQHLGVREKNSACKPAKWARGKRYPNFPVLGTCTRDVASAATTCAAVDRSSPLTRHRRSKAR